jgi:hypothetical protein
LLVMTDEVAITPLVLTVSVLPVTDAVRLLMIFVKPLAIPFTILWKVFVVVARVLVVMILEVATLPFTVEVRVLMLLARVLVVFEALRAVIVACALGESARPPLIVVVPFNVLDVAESGPLILVQGLLYQLR